MRLVNVPALLAGMLMGVMYCFPDDWLSETRCAQPDSVCQQRSQVRGMSTNCNPTRPTVSTKTYTRRALRLSSATSVMIRAAMTSLAAIAAIIRAGDTLAKARVAESESFLRHRLKVQTDNQARAMAVVETQSELDAALAAYEVCKAYLALAIATEVHGADQPARPATVTD